MNDLAKAIEQWRGWFGELHEQFPVERYIDECKFSWRMRHDGGEHDEFTNTDGLTALGNVEKVYRRCLQDDPGLSAVSVEEIMQPARAGDGG